MKLGGNRVFQEIIHDFDNSSEKMKLKFQLGSTPGDNGKAVSALPFSEVTIIIDRTQLEARRTIQVASTFLHEAIHAKIFAELNKIGGYENLNKDNFPELFDEYVNYKNGGAAQNQVQHQTMASKYIDLIAKGIQEFDTRNHGNSEITIDHYRALAWTGLTKTKAYDGLSDEQKQKIKDDKDYIISWASTINCE